MPSQYVLGDNLSDCCDFVWKWPKHAWGSDVEVHSYFYATSEILAENPWNWTPNVDLGSTWYVQLGTNDAIAGITTPEFQANMETIVDYLLQYGATRIELLHAPEIQDEDSTQWENDGYNALVRDQYGALQAVCSQYPEVDCGASLYVSLEHPLDFRYDGVNLSAAPGHYNAAQAILVPEPSVTLALGFGLIALACLARWRRYQRA